MLSFRRKAVNAVMLSLTGVCTFLAVGTLLFILGYLFFHGGTSLTMDFFTKLPTPVGEAGGGMANALLGSAKLLLLASCLGIPIGFLGGVYLAEFGGSSFSYIVRYTTDLLNGVPSIVIGIFAYMLIVLPQKHYSTLAGGLALGVMMIPLITRTTEEMVRMVPGTMLEGALALGATRSHAMVTVVIPSALPGIVTGVVLALARIAGETAPLLFTASNSRYWSTNLLQPISTLPTQVFAYATGPYDDWHRQAWAGALVLITLVLICSILARFATRRLERMQTGS